MDRARTNQQVQVHPRQELPTLIDAGQLADWLATTRSNVYQLSCRGILPPAIRFAGRKRWRVADIQAALDRLVAAAEAEARGEASVGGSERKKRGRPRKAVIGGPGAVR